MHTATVVAFNQCRTSGLVGGTCDSAVPTESMITRARGTLRGNVRHTAAGVCIPRSSVPHEYRQVYLYTPCAASCTAATKCPTSQLKGTTSPSSRGGLRAIISRIHISIYDVIFQGCPENSFSDRTNGTFFRRAWQMVRRAYFESK